MEESWVVETKGRFMHVRSCEKTENDPESVTFLPSKHYVETMEILKKNRLVKMTSGILCHRGGLAEDTGAGVLGRHLWTL